MYNDFIEEPSEGKRISIAFLINVIAMIAFKIYLDLSESEGKKVFCILSIITNIIMLIALCIFVFILKDELSSIYLYFIIFIYITFLPTLVFGIILRASLFEYIKNKYIVCTIIQLICAHGVVSVNMSED